MAFKSVFSVFLAAIAVVLVWISPALAAGNQSNQAINQPATLVAPEPNFQIQVYAKPGSKQVGYGRGGDRVTVLEQVGSNQGYTWDYVRFDGSASTEGWVRSDFVRPQGSDQNSGNSPSQNRSSSYQGGSVPQSQKGYLGSQSPSQGNYQSRQTQGGQYAQNQSSSQSPLSAIKQKVLDFFH